MAVFKTAGGIVEEVRDLHAAFGPLDSPNALCYRFLARCQRNLAAKIYPIAPSYFGQLGASNLVASYTLAIPATQTLFDAGIQITAGPDYLAIREAWAQRTDDPSQRGQDRVEIIPRTRRGAINNRFPFCWIDGVLLFPGGNVEDWAGYSGIHARGVVVSGSSLSAGTLIALQDDAADVMLAKLAEFIASRVAGLPGRVPVDVAYYTEKADAAEAEYLARVAAGTGNQVERIAEVW